ncbi:MAG: nicotinate-nucleotide--dimethylbenzimidazole phosphoribosyltransferase [Sulfurimonas sp.]|uniref:nicotinate-nucleotide--dimethylbenzimidazole phosphoribosyltransferase n=1 Tax=Sulfurimonas sp. TaxID=2022749 RepID=UPI00261E0853|nr:nicotinate-nucleotide--dimethylbenzimidazole phosphoribosyltransferase [Sulfurimonas sp.]MCW8894585.1 nicotinate-nucleotide--dimethylbenzimidazole phosphoribosyltransferase [Sulfurimonas sp.]MCW8953790.1 nicotinate-nucleotide--dimethylbenzimidazole phosphoribosyltransferase [Sulfurimonas sp.]MCW9068022.1 nicotinate-nucleotide--dimethylbenzimidazole phosphoribosyltransferase [Sulfurimonas sp.]
MKTYNIFTNEPDTIPTGKADFLLAASVTKTCEIKGITQAGIPGKIYLTPTLDAEFITNQKVFSLSELAETPTGVPSPAIITRAVHNLTPFSSIEILDLGLSKSPQNSTCQSFGILPSDSIATGANIDAKSLFEKGMKAGKSYELKGNYLILAECVPSGTTTAAATALALGYECKNDFSSSFLNSPDDIKSKTVEKALSLISSEMSRFEKLSIVSDNMLIFCAGFLLEASRRFHIVLAGGTQMAACLLVADALREDVLMRVKSDNITLATTSWVANDENSDIKHLLSLLSYTPHALHTSFSFANAEIPILKKYDEGEAKEGVGAGAALAYAYTNKNTNKELLEAIELIMYTM